MYEKRRVSYWVPLAIVIVLISLIVVYTQSDDNKQVYTGGEVTLPPTVPTTEPPIEMNQYKDAELALTYSIPVDWTRVLKDGHETYIHAPSATSVQVQTVPYSPIVLLCNETNARQELESNGYRFISLEWISNSSYTLLYQNDNTVFIEVVSFDKVSRVNMIYTIPIQYSDRIMNAVTAIIDSVKWEKERPYPENMALVFSQLGTFEFAYPATWYAGIQNSTNQQVSYVMQDPETGTLMAIICNASNASYANTTSVDYVNFASGGRTNFALQTYQSTDSTIYATSTYSASNTNMRLIQYLVATGQYEYMITVEVPDDVYAGMVETISTVVNLLKIYR